MPRRYPDRYMPKSLKAEKSWSRRCNRTRYETVVDAQIALGGMPEGKVARKCPLCHGYHVVDEGVRLEGRGGGDRARRGSK